MRAVSGLMFFPRGGSAHVTRALAGGLPASGWDVTVLTGSCRGLGDAHAFYEGLDVVAVDYDAGDAPLHPSYEDRPGAADRIFAAIGDEEFERHVDAWAVALERARAAEADILHLHHLTPLHEAAARVAPDVPVVGHLHGTELLMLERIAAGAPPSWTHAEEWAERMRDWAAGCERLLVLTHAQVHRAVTLLDIDPERCELSPNGFDPDVFTPAAVDRAAHWRRHLVEEPRGWLPGEGEGSVRYTEAEIAPLLDGPVLVCAGRFTEVKRTGLLVRAFARAQERFTTPASLVFVGGHPGEWEGEHPAEAIAATGVRNVFLAGWQDHRTLPVSLAAADALVLASVSEQFGSVLVEAMGTGLPAIAVDRFGPADIVRPGKTGWLVEPDDEAALAAALIEAVNDPGERARRGEAALADVRGRFAWPAITEHLGAVFDEVAGVAGVRLAPTGS